jgi:hypothetical protein
MPLVAPDRGPLRRTLMAALARATRPHRSTPMLDLIMLAIGLGFFALSVGYAYACERL